MGHSFDETALSIRVRNSKRAGFGATKRREITWVEIETREGYYRDVLDEWQPDRRADPDRRSTRVATAAQKAMRTEEARRSTDREMISYLDTAPKD